jgi:hypothetical protein
MIQRPTWRKVVAALVICAPIVSSEQILPQLVAHLASLDHDHGISLVASDDGVDLVLTHHPRPFANKGDVQSLELSKSESAHVIHFGNGSVMAKQSMSLIVSNQRQASPYFSTAVVTEWRTFVPPLPLVYSRPPPGEISISQLDRSTLLLI